jgi:hypothetical protein
MSVNRTFVIYIYKEDRKIKFYFKGRRLNYDSDNIQSWRHLFQDFYGPFDNFEDLKIKVIEICKSHYCDKEMLEDFILNSEKKQQATLGFVQVGQTE